MEPTRTAAPPVVGRLARFDGSAFSVVAEGEVHEPFVHVFVHGWMPGFRTQERLLATTDGVKALHAWDPRLVDPDGRPLVADYLPLLEALAALGPDHAVLWYSWIDESATEADLLLAHRSRQATQINGRRLAVGLQRALDPRSGRRSRLHLLGHSHGSAVVTHAAVSLRRPPEHLTFLDAPENQLTRLGGAADLIDVVLPRLNPGRVPGRTFVDSYVSLFGNPYHRRPGLADVVDVSLTPPFVLPRDPVRAATMAHLYAVDWYARSVREVGRGVGYGWSPLVTRHRGRPSRARPAEPADHAVDHAVDHADDHADGHAVDHAVDHADDHADDAAPGELAGDARGPVERLHPWYTSPLPQRPLDLRRRPELPLAASATRLTRRTQVRHRRLTGARLTVDETSPEAALVFTTEVGDQLLEFELSVRGGTGDEEIDLSVDGAAAFRSLARFPVPRSGRYVMLADGRPGEHLLTVRLTGRRTGRRADDPPPTANGSNGSRGAHGTDGPGQAPPVTVRVSGLRLVNGPRSASGFTPARTLGAAFAAGAATGAASTLVTLVATGWTARKVLAAITRRRTA